MKKRIGTLKGKPIVEGGGSNIIKENEININDIGSSNNNDDDGIMYFGCTAYGIIDIIFSAPIYKIIDYRTNDDGSLKEVSFNAPYGIPDSSQWFSEFGVNPNIKNIYFNNKWQTIQDILQDLFNFKLEYFKPISKEEFYRTEYTVEEAEKIKQDYDDYVKQFAPSKTE